MENHPKALKDGRVIQALGRPVAGLLTQMLQLAATGHMYKDSGYKHEEGLPSNPRC